MRLFIDGSAPWPLTRRNRASGFAAARARAVGEVLEDRDGKARMRERKRAAADGEGARDARVGESVADDGAAGGASGAGFGGCRLCAGQWEAGLFRGRWTN